MPTTYRAQMITRPGGPEVLQTVDLPIAEPGPGELRVAVRAAGVGATDLTMLAGDYMFAPKILRRRLRNCRRRGGDRRRRNGL
jgi:NADPH:quinone reductase-like Zn-dependent oxidoreductase